MSPFAPAPGSAPLPNILVRQALLELRLQLRNGEQALLTIVIPALLLLLFGTVPIVDLPGRRLDFLAPGVLALAVLSTAFTGQAIATGFDRRYGVLKRLAATPLPRWGLIAAKSAAVLAIEGGQVVLLTAVALLLGWRPGGPPLAALLLLVLGTAAFSGLGLLLAGTLRAEATLAVANLLFLLLLVGGGVVVPLDRLPAPLADVLGYLPLAALAAGLRAVFEHGVWPARELAILAGWAAAAVAAAAAAFRWE